MTAEERLAQLTAGDRRRQARRRDALRQKGMVQQSVWLSGSTRALIDQAIEEGRFRSRSEAVDWALASVFAKEKAMS
jgi:metal-responsive CopG/Arc/MetJ family transcriptional regulator